MEWVLIESCSCDIQTLNPLLTCEPFQFGNQVFYFYTQRVSDFTLDLKYMIDLVIVGSFIKFSASSIVSRSVIILRDKIILRFARIFLAALMCISKLLLS